MPTIKCQTLLQFSFLPIFFPYIGFFPGIDVQPIFLFVLAIAFVFLAIRSVSVSAILLFVSAIVWFLLFVFFRLSDFNARFFLSYIFVFCSIFLLYSVIRRSDGVVSEALVFGVIFVYVLVAIVQLYFDPTFMAGLVHRSEEAVFSYVESGRGVRSLAGEPSHFGKVFSFLNVLLIYISLAKSHETGSNWRRDIFWISVLLLIANGFLSRSAYAFLIHLCIIFFFFAIVFRLRYFFYLFLVAVSFTLVIYFSGIMDGSRIQNIIVLALKNPSLLLEQGAMRRVLNIPISLNNLSGFGIFGSAGSDDRFQTSLWTPIGPLEYEGHSRNIGGLVEVVLRFGVFCVPFLIFGMWLLIRCWFLKLIVANGEVIHFGPFFIFCFFILMVQDGPITLPLGWFVFMMIYMNANRFSAYRRVA